MTSHIEKIREACIKANPEIMELKFGCEVKFSDRVWKFAAFSRTDVVGLMLVRFPDSNIQEFTRINEMAQVDSGKYEILGRPIRLADVLLALGSTGKKDFFRITIGNEAADLIIRIRDGVAYRPNDGGCIWNLKNDNLEHQTPETLAFIADLL